MIGRRGIAETLRNVSDEYRRLALKQSSVRRKCGKAAAMRRRRSASGITFAEFKNDKNSVT